MFWQLIIRVLSFMVAFSSWTFWVQVRGVGSDHNCLSNNGDASVGEGISHVVASIQSGNSARNGVLYPQKGNITILQYLFACFCFKTFNFAWLFFALIHLSQMYVPIFLSCIYCLIQFRTLYFQNSYECRLYHSNSPWWWQDMFLSSETQAWYPEWDQKSRALCNS